MDKGGIIKPIWLPLIVAIIVVPTVVAAVFGGPGLAIIVALVLLIAVVALAARSRPKEPIETAQQPDGTHRVLLALTAPVEDAASAEEVVRAAEARGHRPTQILALAPTRPHFLDRWASDVGEAQAEARRQLDVTVANLRREHLDARSEVGDSDVVLAIEDALREFPADEVVLATGSQEDDPEGAAAARDLAERLPIRFEHVVAGPARYRR
ncbi:MAG: hypothetical protein JSS68_05580 [Actinobacteria bacterium]|nr:hypothetical protein [Actinomycetota bacterium]